MAVSVTISTTAVAATIDDETVAVSVDDEGVAATVNNAQGAAGANGAGINVIEFAWGDASPKSLVTVGAGKTVFSCRVNIDIAFDGTSPALTIGPAGSPASLMSAAQNDPATVAAYETHPGVVYGSATELFLTITPGSGASAGRGQVIFEIEP